MDLISKMPEEQRNNGFVNFAIQLQQGLQYYQSHVAMSNIQVHPEFESKVQLCQKQIDNTISLYQSTKFTNPYVLTSLNRGYCPQMISSLILVLRLDKRPYILTLVGVCTKTEKPLLVSELCKFNIGTTSESGQRRYFHWYTHLLVDWLAFTRRILSTEI